MKKKEKMHEIEQFREKEKERWKSFTHKVVLDPQLICILYLSSSQQSSKSRGGPINSKQKRSIFAVPDSLEGRVSLMLPSQQMIPVILMYALL